jgi:hypothetical protein
MRRTRAGTTGLSTVAAPRPASVGVRAAASSSASQTPNLGEQGLGEEEPGADGQRKPHQQQPSDEGAVGPQLPRLKLRRVVEQHQYQRHLGEGPDGRAALTLRVNQRQTENATRDEEDDRTAQVRLTETRRLADEHDHQQAKTQIATPMPPSPPTQHPRRTL